MFHELMNVSLTCIPLSGWIKVGLWDFDVGIECLHGESHLRVHGGEQHPAKILMLALRTEERREVVDGEQAPPQARNSQQPACAVRERHDLAAKMDAGKVGEAHRELH